MMTRDLMGTVAERLARNSYQTDEEFSHIEIDQRIVRATGTGGLLVDICPAHVYAEEADGTISAEYAACLECGTCLAVMPSGSLSWHYPRGGFGIEFREG